MHKRRCSGGRRYNRPAARIESAPRRTLIFETLCALSPRRGGAETLQGLTGERASASHVNSGTTAPHRARTPHSAEPLRGAAAPHRRTPPQSGTAPHRRLAAYEKIGTPNCSRAPHGGAAPKRRTSPHRRLTPHECVRAPDRRTAPHRGAAPNRGAIFDEVDIVGARVIDRGR